MLTTAPSIEPRAMLTTAPSIEPQAMLTIVATVKLLVASRAKLDAMLGPRKKAVLEIEQGDVLEAVPTTAPRLVLGVGPTVMRRPLPIRNSMLPVRKTSPVL